MGQTLVIVGFSFHVFFLNLTHVSSSIIRLQMERLVGLLFKKLVKTENSCVLSICLIALGQSSLLHYLIYILPLSSKVLSVPKFEFQNEPWWRGWKVRRLMMWLRLIWIVIWFIINGIFWGFNANLVSWKVGNFVAIRKF